jgi:hypothetical protein
MAFHNWFPLIHHLMHSDALLFFKYSKHSQNWFPAQKKAVELAVPRGGG